MKAVIIDDEQKARSALKQEISLNCPDIELMGEAAGVVEAVELIDKLKPELLFLDIQLSDGNGFEVLEHTNHESYHTIFTTAWSEYALKAFKTNAIDYLLKPVDGLELKQAVTKATQYSKHHSSQQITALLSLFSKKAADDKIVLKDIHKTYFLKPEEIMFCEAEGIYTKFMLQDSTTILVSKNLKEYETMLEPHGFIRTHHSFLVNIRKIKVFDKSEGGVLVLDNDAQVPVSQRKKELVLKMLERK